MRRAFAFLLAFLLLAPAFDAAAQQKTIKDPAEYKAYMAAYDQKDAARRAAAMEAFAAKYPHSVVRLDALEQAMAGFQQTGHRDKVGTLAAEILKLDPDNLRALAIHVFLLRAKATADNDTAALAELKAAVERALGLLAGQKRPAGMNEAEYVKLRAQIGTILNGAAGFVALQAKDYAGARLHYLEAVKGDPNDLQNVYQLSLACLEASPVESDGFWYIARAIALAAKHANAAVKDSIGKYAAAKYAHYHGSDEGWAEILVKAAKASAKPVGFSVKAAP